MALLKRTLSGRRTSSEHMTSELEVHIVIPLWEKWRQGSPWGWLTQKVRSQ